MSLIVISSEIEELVAYSTRVVVLRDHAHVAELDGAPIDCTSDRRIDRCDQREGSVLIPIMRTYGRPPAGRSSIR